MMFRYIWAWLQALFGYVKVWLLEAHDSAWLGAAPAMEEEAVTVSLGPIGPLFQQLRSVIASLQGNSRRLKLKGVKAQIQILGQELEGLCIDLKGISEAPADAMTMCWMRQVRDLCYDTADYLDELMHFIHDSSGTRRRLFGRNRLLRSKTFRISRRLTWLCLPKLKKMRRAPLIVKLSALVARVEDADESHQRFKLSPPTSSKPDYAQAAAFMPQTPPQLHIDNLNELLALNGNEMEKNLKVVTIFGSAGVGKTAIARALYHQHGGRFQHRAFIRVSRDPDMRRLLTDMLSQIKAPLPHAFSDVQGLIGHITQHLQGKRYLIIIDDLWSTPTWDIIIRALPAGDYCRIITTTQVEDVALACCSYELKHIYQITPLNNDQSGKSEGGCTTYPSSEGMKEALNLVYNNLPPRLKTCLLYLNMYPEGCTLRKDELVKQWVAEDFISSVQGQDIEDTAGCYFDTLVSSELVQSVDTNHSGEVLSCTLHHMVLDLIRQKSMEENFVTIVNYFQTILGLPDKVRRLSVQLGGAKGANNIPENMRISQVRSLLFSGFFKRAPSIVHYGLLQVLVLHIWSDKDEIFDLATIGGLYRLRYLKIECNITVKLPHKIQRLRHLGTLQVDSRLHSVPSGIVHLEKLLHLRLPSESVLPHGVGRMTCLRSLGYFDLGRNSEDNLRDLGDLKNLQDLQLTCSTLQPGESLENNMQLLGSVLKKLSILQSVTLVPTTDSSKWLGEADVSRMCISCDSLCTVSPAPAHLQRLELSYRCCIFSKLPKWLGELAKLRILKIAVGELLKENIDILKVLPALAVLSLHLRTMTAERIVFGKGGFKVLTYFKFTCTVSWLKFEVDAMPNLEKLKLSFNSLIVDEQGAASIIIEHLSSGIREISANICCTGVDARSALLKAIRNDPRNPEVQLMGSIYYDDVDRGTVTREGSGEEENNEAHSRIHMLLKSSRPPVPVHCREEELEDRPSICDIISIPSESGSTYGHTGQVKIHRLPRMGDESVLERILNGDEDPMDLPLSLLQSITNDFSQETKIGQGGFGEVYKGELQSGIIVAVKRIYVNQHTIDDKLFRREVNSLRKINHQNIVRFLGFCSNTHHISREEAGEINLVNVRERILCFEYIRNGSLDKHITDELRGLEWEPRYAIISGICKGLFYLHEEKEIVHMDLKPPNILLDDHMVPKITDFGLSRSNEMSHTTGQRFGTPGYVAPEYEKDGKTSFKCDVYSLGVIITELVTGRKSIPHKSNVLRRWRHRWNKPPTLLQYQQVTRCIEIAVRCRQQELEARPSIGDIIDILSESECTDGQTGQGSTYLDDDMLGIEPLELRFDEEMSWSVKLTNKTKACFAFSIEIPSKQYTIEPDKGIVPPGCSVFLVKIAVKTPQVTQNDDKLIVRSTKVPEGLRIKDITEHIFHEEVGKVVDEVDLMVVYEPVEAASPTRKAINSSSYEDGARGQRDRCNFHPPENFSRSQPTNETYLLRVSDRAIDVTRGAMGSLLHKLGELLEEEFNLEASVKKDVQSLSEELVKMQVVLRKVSEAQQDNLDDLVKRWASNVREMSYDLEDFVDSFLVHNEPDSNTSGFRELTHEMCFLLEMGKSQHTISNLIKDKSKQVQDVAKKCKEYKVDNVVPNASAKAAIDELRILAIYEDEEQLVGIETPRDELIRLFEEDSDVSKQNLKIVSIVGLGGLGKTTLAKAVYDKLKAQYDLKTFVSVGQNPVVKEVLKKILRKFVKGFNAEYLDVGELIEELQELLQDKRYFIVIDDIWDSEAWGLIKYAFPRNNHGSRVITTTRIERVALDCCKVERKYVYRMKSLGEEDSRRLFLRRIFGPENDCANTPRKEEISKYILKKCGGMPLAIISIASLLAGEPASTWDYVRKTMGAMTEGDDLENMKQILDLSYIQLPDHLKTCLLHVCMYPEDREINKNDLLRQWVAEGFVITNGRLDAEDVAEKYFKELINMCMIQPGKIDDCSNEVLSCRVHDIILDLMRSKSSKENFIHVIDGSKDETGEIRRVSVQYNDKEDMRILETINEGSLSHVRSVLLFRSSLVDHFLESKYVRVLYLEIRGIGGNIDLTGISWLFLLRYLKVASSYGIELKLPNQIGELQQLETIDLAGARLENFPSDIVSLPWLSHLTLMGSVLPDGIDRLKSLRTLEGVDVLGSSVENIKGLSKLTNLRKLEILSNLSTLLVEETTMDALYSSFWKLSASLRTFTFEGGLFYKPHVPGWITRTPFPRGSHIQELDLSGCSFQRCPEWIGQLHSLYKLCISVREVADGVSIAARLPSLAYFRLSVLVTDEEEEKEESVVIPGTGDGAFRALKHLYFDCKKASLTFEAGAMPKLEELSIHFRDNMAPQFLPVGIHHLPAGTLEQISLHMLSGTSLFFISSDAAGQHLTSMRHLLEGAFKPHHPTADIIIYIF